MSCKPVKIKRFDVFPADCFQVPLAFKEAKLLAEEPGLDIFFGLDIFIYEQSANGKW